LRRHYEFIDLQSFLDLYYSNMAVLRSADDFADMTRAYLTRAVAAGVRHAEIMMDPQAHLSRGIPLATSVGAVAEVLAKSESEFGISTELIAAFLRDRPAEEAVAVLDDLLAMEVPIIGIGLDSAERGNPPRNFVALYERARQAGLKCVAHAGEEGPPDYIREALDLLAVDRIDHGIRCMEDEALVERLVAEQVPLTVCPLSNVRLRAVDTLPEHPLPRMLERGLNVSVNSDDPAYFGGYIDENFRQVRSAFGFSTAQMADLAANSVMSAFLTDSRRRELLAEVEQWRHQHP
jgi:adenosine deaminase